MVRAQQKSVLRSGMVARRVGNRCRSNLQLVNAENLDRSERFERFGSFESKDATHQQREGPACLPRPRLRLPALRVAEYDIQHHNSPH